MAMNLYLHVFSSYLPQEFSSSDSEDEKEKEETGVEEG